MRNGSWMNGEAKGLSPGYVVSSDCLRGDWLTDWPALADLMAPKVRFRWSFDRFLNRSLHCRSVAFGVRDVILCLFTSVSPSLSVCLSVCHSFLPDFCHSFCLFYSLFSSTRSSFLSCILSFFSFFLFFFFFFFLFFFVFCFVLLLLLLLVCSFFLSLIFFKTFLKRLIHILHTVRRVEVNLYKEIFYFAVEILWFRRNSVCVCVCGVCVLCEIS